MMTINTYFFSRLPAPESRKPFANGLLSIFNWVIYILWMEKKELNAFIVELRPFLSFHSNFFSFNRKFLILDDFSLQRFKNILNSMFYNAHNFPWKFVQINSFEEEFGF